MKLGAVPPMPGSALSPAVLLKAHVPSTSIKSGRKRNAALNTDAVNIKLVFD